jgi:hypothetical protein
MRKSAYNPLSFDDVLKFCVAEALEDCEVEDLRQIVLDQLRSAGEEGSKAAPIRSHAKQILERDFPSRL